MAYSIAFTRPAQKQLADLPLDVQKRIAIHIDALAEQPRPPESTRMVGTLSVYRLRIGNYRVIYAVSDDPPTVIIGVVGHRRNVYELYRRRPLE